MDTLETTEDRPAAYWLLAQCYHPPDEQLLDTLRHIDVQGLYLPAGVALDDLQRDYAQLFLGPFSVSAPPYGSVYLENDRRVCGETTMDVIARYGEEGLQITLKEPADHVAIELEYMYLLALREKEALGSGDKAAAADCFEKQRIFLQTHLGIWIPKLADLIVENARTSFYRHVATATDSIVRRDLRFCSNRIMSSVCRERGGAP